MDEKLSILLVDDNPSDRMLALRELRKAFPAVEVHEAHDQRKLTDLLDSIDVDLVITDYHLNWSTGLDVLKRIKAMAPHCPVIMFTGTGSEEVAVEAMKLGLDDYIIKNARHMVRLRGAVETVLRNSRARLRERELSTQIETILSQLEVGVFSCSPDGELLDASPSLLRLLDYGSMEELRGSQFARAIQGLVAALAQTADVSAAAARFERDVLVEEGPNQGRVFQLCAKPLSTANRIFRVDGMVEDITLRRRAEEDSRAAAVAEAQIAMLSPREREVFEQVVSGHANKKIARRLDISEKTVEKHRASLMKKVGAHSVAELVRLSMLSQRSE